MIDRNKCSVCLSVCLPVHGYGKLVWIAVLVKLSYGCAVGYDRLRLFHIFMVLGKKDVLNTCVRA